MGTHPIFESDFDSNRFVRIFLKVCRLKESGQQKKSQKMTLARRTLSPFCTNMERNAFWLRKRYWEVPKMLPKPKEVLIEAYEELFKTGSFKGSEMDKVIEK